MFIESGIALKRLWLLVFFFLTVAQAAAAQVREFAGLSQPSGRQAARQMESISRNDDRFLGSRRNENRASEMPIQLAQSSLETSEFFTWLQVQLRDVGLYTGRTNGIGGPDTFAAWRAFARAANVRPEPNDETTQLLFYAASIRRAIQVDLSDAIRGAKELREVVALSRRAEDLFKAGRYAEAIPLEERALPIRERWLGSKHPDVAMNLHDLAKLHMNLGHYAEALPYLRRALTLRENALGSEHPDIATTMEDLAFALQRLDR